MKKQLILLAMAAFVFSFFVVGEAKAPKKITRPQITLRHDRDFGYFIGDVVIVGYKVTLPGKPGEFQISLTDLPQAGEAVKEGIEFKEAKIAKINENEKNTFLLELKFQIFQVFKEPSNIVLPKIGFFYGSKENPSRHKGTLPSVAVRISPLCGQEKPSFQPFFEPGPRPTKTSWFIILGSGIFAFLGLAWLAVILIKERRSPSVFKKALKAIRQFKPEEYNKILLSFQRALNQKAGQAIFPDNLDNLFKVFPAARKRTQKILDILVLQESVVFNPNYQADPKILSNLKERVVAELKWFLRKER